MIRAKLAFQGRDVNDLFSALEPDNLPNIMRRVEGDRLLFELAVSKMGTLLSTLDDLLMNLKIAEETLAALEEK